jgi:hypothetical protein
MAVNLIDIVQRYLSGPVMRQISSLLGENEAKTQAAVSMAVPATIGALIKQASTPSGASSLSSLLDKADTGMLANLTSSLSGGAKGLMDKGAHLVNSLFGSSASAATDSISRASGLTKEKTASLLALVAPVAVGALAKVKRDQGLDAAGLASLLDGQSSFLSGLLPAGLADVLGIGNLVGSAGAKAHATADRAAGYSADAGRATARTAQAAAHEGSSLLKKILPIAVLALLGLILWGWFANRSKPVEAAPPVKTELAGGTQAELKGFIDNATSALRGVTDVESAKAAVPKLQAATQSINTLSSKLSALSAEARSSLSASAATAKTSLQALADKALALPGVSDVLKPAVTSLMDALGKLRA